MGSFFGGGSCSIQDINPFLPEEFLGKENSKIKKDDIFKTNIIGVYFSAHWCGPCRKFTPKLANFYNEINSKGKKIEIIYNSCDNDEDQFNEYYNTMPWLAVPYDSDLREEISNKCGISSIPTLLIFDNKGHLIDSDGRSSVEGMGLSAIDNWIEKSKQLSEVKNE